MTYLLPALKTETCEVLETAALAGAVLDVNLLCRACGRSEAELVTLLEEAAGLGLVCEVNGQLTFAAGVREAMYGRQLSVRRVLRHKRLAEVVEDPDEQAYHLGQVGVPEAAPQLRAAGDRAMLAGNRLLARAFYQRALELCRTPEPELLLLAGQLEAAAASGDPVVAPLARYQLLVCQGGGDSAWCLRQMDRAHKELSALWRNERLEALLALLDGRGRQVCGVPGGLALAFWRSGRPAEAEVIVRESLMEGGVVAQGPLEQWVLANVATLRGDLDEAFRRYELAVSDALARQDSAAAARWAGEWLDLLTFARGTEKETILGLAERVAHLSAVAVARTGVEQEPRRGYLYWRGDWEPLRQGPGWWGALVALAEKRSLPRPLAEGDPGVSPRYGQYGETMWGMSLQARACIQAGDAATARAWLETVDAWQGGPRPSLWHYALNRVEWARWHAAVGDQPAAHAAAEEALELGLQFNAPTALVFPALCLLGRLAEARTLADVAGPPQLARSLAGGAAPVRSDGLTAREAEVAALVAQGLTDREIGERLFISPRTVDGHLRNIFRKLDLQSRTALAAWVLSGELSGDSTY